MSENRLRGDCRVDKKTWRKPEVKELRAGAAEVNTGGVDDGDVNAAKDNS